MRQLNIKIPDNKYDSFIELIKELDYIEIEENLSLSDEQIKIVNDRMQKSLENPERILKWDDVKDSIKL